MKKTIVAIAVIVASFSVNATNNNNVQQQLDDLKAGLHNVHMNTLQKYSESWGLEDRANIAKLQETKVDKTSQSVRDSGQDEHINAVQNAAQIANEKGDVLAVRADNTEASLAVTDNRSINNAVRLDGVEGGLRETNAQVEYNASYAQSRLDAADANNEANRQSLAKSNKVIASHSAELANHEQRLGNLEQSTNKNFADMGKRIDRVQDKANAGVSAALSSAAIPQVTEYQRFALGAGVGGYEGESALAVGFSSRVSSAVVIKASVTTDSQDGFGYNAGVSVGW